MKFKDYLIEVKKELIAIKYQKIGICHANSWVSCRADLIKKEEFNYHRLARIIEHKRKKTEFGWRWALNGRLEYVKRSDENERSLFLWEPSDKFSRLEFLDKLIQKEDK